MEEEGPEKCLCGKEATIRSNFLDKSFCSIECEEDGWREYIKRVTEKRKAATNGT